MLCDPIMKWPWAIIVGTAGCSSAPVADTLDWLRPGYTAPERSRDPDGPPPRIPLPPERTPSPVPPNDTDPPPLPPVPVG